MHPFALLVTLLLVGSSSVSAQNVSPDSLPLSEQFRMHYFIEDSIIAVLPGYVDFDTEVCHVTVYLVDTLHWADSARALFRPALPPDTSEVAQEYCGGTPEVRVRAAQYTRTALWAFARRIDTILAEPLLRVRGSAWLQGDSLIVSVHSRAGLERARLRLARELGIPQTLLVFRVHVPEEIDGPVSPPRAAYLAVLDTIAAAPPEGQRPFVINLRSLPSTVGVDDIRKRGLRPRLPSDSCQPLTVVSFEKPRQFASGSYWFATSWRLNNYAYEVRCESGLCRVIHSGQLAGDKLGAVGCPKKVGSDPSKSPRPDTGLNHHKERRDLVTIPVAIESIESADFLTEAQQRDIFYNNAARFLRLSDEEVAKDHGNQR